MSSSKEGQKVAQLVLGVIPVAKAEQLLTDWANLPGPWPLVLGNDAASREVGKRFADAQKWIQQRHKDVLADSFVVGDLKLRDFLRKAWDSPDLREREWFLYKFRDHYQNMVRRFDMSYQQVRKDEADEMNVMAPRHAPPPLTAIEAAAFYLNRNFDFAQHCLNPDCAAPYFFGRRRGQKYCSGKCAGTAKRAAKLRWWTKNRAGKKRKRRS